AKAAGMALSELYEVLSFYAMLSTEPRGRYVVEVCRCTPCTLADDVEVARILEGMLDTRMGETTTDGTFTLEWCSCLGRCNIGPVMKIGDEVYGELDEAKIARILEDCRKQEPEASSEADVTISNIRLIGPDRDLTLLHSIDCDDPSSIEDYRKMGGYEGLRQVLASDEAGIFEQMDASGLLGRGGANYPTARRWASLRSSIAEKGEGTSCPIVCNADEGEPGMFKDRMLLERAPLSIIEGMTIAGRAFHAKQGYIYIRGEYRLLQKAFDKALVAAREAGLLGDSIDGVEGFDFDIAIVSGAGSYVCGENSALLSSIEGRASRPRNKPPYLTDRGLFDEPTLVQNVETYACIAALYRQGGEAFHNLGTPDDGGPRLVVFSGQAANRGICEVRPGITLRELVYSDDFAGGTASGRPLKFMNISGQTGRIAFPEDLDATYSYDGLKAAGLAMGSGGFVLADEGSCAVDYLRGIIRFLVDESCGRCVPCREGMKDLLTLMDNLCSGQAKPGDVDRIVDMAAKISRLAACGLADGVSKPVDSLVGYFREEFEMHERGICPVGTCIMEGGTR
ncbi:MAG: hypothetical protein HGA54_03970, partial [Actinobacteria bacterium]|nr:hypothetical protein [Actinomycetota bacterium]